MAQNGSLAATTVAAAVAVGVAAGAAAAGVVLEQPRDRRTPRARAEAAFLRAVRDSKDMTKASGYPLAARNPEAGRRISSDCHE
jgi:hypothetical protein